MVIAEWQLTPRPNPAVRPSMAGCQAENLAAASTGRIRPEAEFGEFQFLKPCTHDLRYIDSFHASLFACGYKVDSLDTCVRENTLTCLCTSSRRCSTDRVTGKSNSFKFFFCSCHIEFRFEKLMDVSGKPFIAHGIASPQPQQTTRNDHVSIHAFDLRMDIRFKSPLLARPQSSH